MPGAPTGLRRAYEALIDVTNFDGMAIKIHRQLQETWHIVVHIEVIGSPFMSEPTIEGVTVAGRPMERCAEDSTSTETTWLYQLNGWDDYLELGGCSQPIVIDFGNCVQITFDLGISGRLAF